MIKKTINIKIGIGEAIDRHSILIIKSIKIKNRDKLEIIREQCNASINDLSDIMILVKDLYDEIFNINLALWEVEDKLRILESTGTFDDEFIKMARSVYHLNDTRHAIKCAIDDRVGFKSKEQKEYIRYEKDIGLS